MHLCAEIKLLTKLSPRDIAREISFDERRNSNAKPRKSIARIRRGLDVYCFESAWQGDGTLRLRMDLQCRAMAWISTAKIRNGKALQSGGMAQMGGAAAEKRNATTRHGNARI